jgi:hypothetical protein
MMEETLVNRVQQSGLINLNLELWYPQFEIIDFDIKPHLFMGKIVKEKEYRESLKDHDWQQYTGKIVLVQSIEGTIIPIWAKMLIATYLEGIAYDLFMGDKDQFINQFYKNYFDSIDFSHYENQRIVVKGCGEKQISDAVYAYLTFKLKPYVKSILFGEACSSVPIYKLKN